MLKNIVKLNASLFQQLIICVNAQAQLCFFVHSAVWKMSVKFLHRSFIFPGDFLEKTIDCVSHLHQGFALQILLDGRQSLNFPDFLVSSRLFVSVLKVHVACRCLRAESNV